jgi:hypothetical protein
MALAYLGCILFALSALSMAQSNSTPAPKQPSATGAQGTAVPGTSQTSQQPTPQPQVKEVPGSDGQQYSSPTVVMLPSSANPDDESPVLPVPEKPDGRVSLIGGTVDRVDQIRNRMSVHIFGGGSMKVFFDERSRIYRDGVETTQLALKQGERVYLDTQLDNDRIFARNIHIKTKFQPADATGQIVSYDSQRGEFTLMDRLSGRPVRFRTTSDTLITAKQRNNTKPVLQRGALVNVKFAPGPQRQDVAREVELLIEPGAIVNFYGTLTSVNLRTGLLGIRNKSDDQLYGVHFSRSTNGLTEELQPGAEVVIESVFNGSGYDARNISVNRTASEVKEDQPDEDQDQNQNKDNPRQQQQDQDNPR